MRSQETRTTSERPFAKGDARESTVTPSEGERKPPRSEVVSDLAALVIVGLLNEHTNALLLVLEGLRRDQLPPHVLSAIKDHAASCERLTHALEAR